MNTGFGMIFAPFGEEEGWGGVIIIYKLLSKL